MSYNTSKSAVLQMARSMACELGPKRIRVNTLSPGHIYTKCVTVCSLVIQILACPWLGSPTFARPTDAKRGRAVSSAARRGLWRV